MGYTDYLCMCSFFINVDLGLHSLCMIYCPLEEGGCVHKSEHL